MVTAAHIYLKSAASSCMFVDDVAIKRKPIDNMKNKRASDISHNATMPHASHNYQDKRCCFFTLKTVSCSVLKYLIFSHWNISWKVKQKGFPTWKWGSWTLVYKGWPPLASIPRWLKISRNNCLQTYDWLKVNNKKKQRNILVLVLSVAALLKKAWSQRLTVFGWLYQRHV